ncbi:hypothetical protein [Clostridioides sp. ZZV15-6597]|uniref:hypothetical protein n=1 Tax=Clostridioides sp. ZZV15-6597 TaxID=2811500 RepID=UPI001D11E23F|nr:hypothetical protein [Clostridioides sp. ZZV15-6597]
MRTSKIANTHKENLSVAEIQKLCAIAGNIEANIQSNDKTPSWDGELFLYKKNKIEKENCLDNKKENLLKKINIQLKANEVKKLSGKKRTFSMNVSDLRNYYNNEGVILFVVEIESVNKMKVYCRNLLPVDLINILNEIDRNKKNQLTKSVELYELRFENNHFERIVNSFYRNINKQTKNLVDKQIELSERDKEISIDIAEIDNRYDLFNRGVYAYKPLKHEDLDTIDLPCVNKLYLKELNTKAIVDIFIKNNIYKNNEYILTLNKNNHKITINNFIVIYIYRILDEKLINKSIDINFTIKEPSGTVDSHLNNLKMLLDIFKYKKVLIKEFSTKDELIDLDLKTMPCEENDLIENILFFEDFKNLLDILEIKQENFLLDNMSHEDYGKINTLINIFINNKTIKRKNMSKDSGFTYMKINEKKIILYKIETDNSWNLINIFDEKNKLTITQKEGDMQCSPYILLNYNDMDSINFDVNKATINIKKYKKTPEYTDRVMSYILELIKYYDKVLIKEYLIEALELLEWIENEIDVDINKINKYQIVKRIRNFSIDEILDLDNIKRKNSKDIMIQCAINILIEKSEEAKNNMNNMSKELLNKFKLYPIYNLYDKKSKVQT